MRRRSALSTLALCSLAIAACSGGDDDTTSTTEPVATTAADEPAGGDEATPSDEPADEPAAEEMDDDLASAMWVFNDAEFETNDLWRGADADGRLRGWQILSGAPTVAVADTSDAHIAFVSDDLINFRPVHRGCCGFTLADRLGDRIAIASVSPAATTVFGSPDGGATWTTTEIPMLGGTPENPFLLSDLLVTESGYLATATPSQGGALPPGAVFTSTDLTTWTTVALPGLDPALGADSSIELHRGGTGEIWIVAVVDTGASDRVVPFRSVDGGTTLEPEPELAASVTAVATVTDRLVAWPTGDDAGAHPWLLIPGAGWARAPADIDRWGTEGLQIRRWGTDPDSGRIVALIERFGVEPSADCDPAVSECELRSALVTSADGLAWDDVDAPSIEPDAPGDPTGVAAVPAPIGRDGWLIWEPDAGSDAVTAYRWTGPAPIPAYSPETDG